MNQHKPALWSKNFNGNEIKNFSFEKLSTAPSNPFESQTYYNTNDNIIYTWNGTEWISITTSTLTVADDSTAFVTISNGELSFNNLAITGVTVDTTETSLANFITANYTVGNEFQEGDMIILTNATDQTQRSWIHNGGAAVTSDDFTRLQTDLDMASVRAEFVGGDGLTYTEATGTFDVNTDNSTVEISGDNLQVKDLGISASKLADNSVTNAKLADNSVGTAEIIDSNVTTSKIANEAITQDKIDELLEAMIKNHKKQILGNGVDTTFTFTNAFGTSDITCCVWVYNSTSSKWEKADCMVEVDDSNVYVGAFPAPATDSLKVIYEKAILS